MKKTLNFCFVMALASMWIGCSKSPKEKAVLDYVQTIGNSKIDMSAAVVDLRKERDMYGVDSLIVVMAEIQAIDDPGSDRREELLKRVENYTDSRSQMIGEFWFCTYRLKNPLMNNAKQEVSTYFMFQGDDLIGVMDVESYKSLTEITNKNLK